MAPQELGLTKHHDEPPWYPDDEEESGSPLLHSTSMVVGTDIAMTMETPSPTEAIDYTTRKSRRPPATDLPDFLSTSLWPGWPRERPSSSIATSITRTNTPYGESQEPATLSTTPTAFANKPKTSPSATTTDESGSQRPHWPRPTDRGSLYAAAAVVPIVVLAIIAGLAFYCLRKRRRQRERAATSRMTAQEMKMQPQATTHPYIAPALAGAPQYPFSASQPPRTSDLRAPPPVILGPIPSGVNGAYLTGIDTSDVVSVTSNNLRPADPFADNSSLAEPPPPYRPHSVAPPSFVSASRQSSFRAQGPPPTTSQTRLIERSPFDDPEDDDIISEISGPTLGRDGDTMSAVSDLSYQHDPVVARSSLA